MRDGLFSASQVYRLAKDGRKKGEPSAQFYSYVTEKFYEIVTGCSLVEDQKTKYTEWGNEMERYLAGWSMKATKWHHKPEDRLYNYDIHFTGELDFTLRRDVFELKSPYTKKSFCDLTMSLAEGTLKETHEDYYWQLAGQKILYNADKTILTVFMPCEWQKQQIMEHLQGSFFHGWCSDKLPFLPDSNEPQYFFDVHIPDEDLNKLVSRLKMAKESLISLFKQKQKWIKLISI